MESPSRSEPSGRMTTCRAAWRWAARRPLDLVEALIASAPDSDAVAVVSAGPLEELVYGHGAALVDEDVAACLALLQSEQLTGSVVDRLWQRIVERLSGEGLLGAPGKTGTSVRH